MSELPPPLVGAEVDLRAFDWFPFYHKRLRQSSFWKRASDLACRISVDFWAEAFEQVPAGSLPDDDYILAEWAGFGRRNLDGWLAVKDEVMSAWTRCSDGRWYHPTLSEVARKQWAERQLHQWERECDRIRKQNIRRAKDGLEQLPLPPKPSQEMETSEGTPEVSGGRPPDVQGHPPEIALKGKGKGKGKGKEDILSSSLRSEDSSPAAPATAQSAEPAAVEPPRRPPKPRKHPYPEGAFGGWYRAYPRKQARSAAEKAFRKIEAADDTPFADLMAGIDRFHRVQPDIAFWPHPASWLNGKRWLDEPTSTAARPTTQLGDEPRIDFGGGVSWRQSVVRKQVERWQSDPASWPEGTLGPPPNTPGCRVPEHLLEAA